MNGMTEKRTEAVSAESNHKKQTGKRIWIYLGLTFGLTYLWEFCAVYPVAFHEDTMIAQFYTVFVAAAMFLPALSVLLTRLITKEGFGNSMIRLRLKENKRYYQIGYFGPAVLTLLGMGIYFLIFPGQFDLEMTYLQSLLTSVPGQELPADTVTYLQTSTVVQLLVAIFLAPILNFLPCFGEEWGWRGYLLPKMLEKYSMGKVLLISGIIWGLWHAPITAIGHNYGMGYAGWPVTGILAMCLFCIVMGVIFSYVTIKSGSCIPAVLAHGSLNGIAGIGIYFCKDGGNPFVGPAPTGIIGGSAFIVTAILMAVLLIKEKGK